MMKTIIQAVAVVALMVCGANAQKVPGIKQDVLFGGIMSGRDFNDRHILTSGEVVKGVRIKSGERIDGVGIILEDDMGKPSLHYHGGIGGESYTLWLDEGEHITSMKAHLGGEDGRTRIYYLEFSTNLNNVISSGTRTDRTVNSTAPEGYQVGGFHGSSGKELDSVGIIWTSIERMQ